MRYDGSTHKAIVSETALLLFFCSIEHVTRGSHRSGLDLRLSGYCMHCVMNLPLFVVPVLGAGVYDSDVTVQSSVTFFLS